MTRKSFAAIKSAQEALKLIHELAEEAAHKPMVACKNAKQISAIAAKWNADFADCDPAWQAPQRAVNNGHANAVALGAFVQTT